jgi:hypothetical protein
MFHKLKSKLRTYRSRVKRSHCRRTHRAKSCKRIPGCTFASGTVRRFCRKRTNKHVNLY